MLTKRFNALSVRSNGPPHAHIDPVYLPGCADMRLYILHGFLGPPHAVYPLGGSVAKWLACWTQAQ